MDAIVINGLTKKYGKLTAVDNLSFSVKEGELLSLLGLNGAGKTTTVKMLSCITSPDSGDACICGKSIIKDTEQVKTLIAVSPQENAVASGLTVYENLDLICGAYGIKKQERKAKISHVIALLGLEEYVTQKAGRLSGGCQRRLSIAMALIGNPKVLFLDEPTLGLDVIARSALWDIIRSLKGKVTIILTTHYMEEAEALSDKVAIMRTGRLLILETPEQIKKQTGAANLEQAFLTVVKEERI